MRIHNVHERTLPISREDAWALVESLGRPEDRLWPHHRWPRMSRQGDDARHGFVRYRVVGRVPRQSLRFRFHEMRGVEGEHAFEVLEAGENRAVLRHTMIAEMRGPAELGWRLLVGRWHDALLEDLLDGAEGRAPRRHSRFVRLTSASVRRLAYRRP